jgi:hypothetical protein
LEQAQYYGKTDTKSQKGGSKKPMNDKSNLGADDCVAASQACLHLAEDALEIRAPGSSGDLDLAGSDLPHVAHRHLDERFFAIAVRRPLRPPHNRCDLDVRHRIRKRTNALHFNPRHRYLHRAGDEEIARLPHS